jgi:hypothetical protein
MSNNIFNLTVYIISDNMGHVITKALAALTTKALLKTQRDCSRESQVKPL